MRTCIDSAKSWNSFTNLFEKCMDLLQYKREVKSISESSKSELCNLLSINVTSAIGVSVLAKNAAEKRSKVLYAISLLLRLKAKTDNSKILVSLRRRISQQLKTAAHSYSQPSSEIELQCSNTGSWEAAICYLIELENDNIVLKKNANYLKSNELSSLATLLIDSTAVSLEELKLYLPERYKTYIPKTVVKQIIMQSKDQFLVNVHQIDFHCKELNEIFETQLEDDRCDLIKQSTDNCQKGKSGGRRGIENIFPSIPNVATEFIKSHGFRAQERKRTSTITSSVVTINEIREHLLKNIPSLKEHGISKQTVRWLFKPFRKDNHAAVRYKGIINATIPKKDNTGRKYKGDSHFILSHIKLRREFAEYFKEETTIVSTDNMNKIRYGASAVSRHHQIRKIYMENDAPQLSDHDFPF